METWLVEFDNGITEEFTGSVALCWAVMLRRAVGIDRPAWVSAVKILEENHYES